jgi:hypothetical protein
MDNVIHINTMREADYKREREQIRAMYGDGKGSEKAQHERALGALWERCGWHQREIAKKEGKSQSYISQLITYGKFIATGNKFSSLTERAFRKYWLKTDGSGKANEASRFQQVTKMLEANADKRPPKEIRQSIIQKFSDGKFRSARKMAEKIDAPAEDIEAEVKRLQSNSRTSKVEFKDVGKERQYCIFKMEKTIPASELETKLAPIIKRLEAEGKKNMATMSPDTVALLARDLRQLLETWAE